LKTNYSLNVKNSTIKFIFLRIKELIQ